MAIETRYTFSGNNTATDLRDELIAELYRRHANVADTDHAAGERIALESLIYMLNHLDIKESEKESADDDPRGSAASV